MGEQTDKFLDKAKELAKKDYLVLVYEEELSDGKKIFFVKNPELQGCMAQGKTRSEALAELEMARVAYIQSLLLSGFEIPEPATTKTEGSQVSLSTNQGESSGANLIWGEFEQVLERVIQPSTRKLVDAT